MLDGLLVVASMLFAALAHALLYEYTSFVKRPVPQQTYAVIAYAMVPTWLVLVAWLRMHRTFERAPSQPQLIVDLLKLHALAVVALAVALFVTQTVINRTLVGLFFGATFLSSWGLRTGIGLWVRDQHRRGHTRLRTLLVGDPGKVMGSVVQSAAVESLPPEIIGYVGGETDDETWTVKRLGSIEDIERVLHDNAVDEALFFAPYDYPSAAQDALHACETVGTPARFAVSLEQLYTATPRIVTSHEQPFISFEVSPKPAIELAVKQALDVVAAAIGIIVLSPVLIGVSLAVWITMGRPLFFGQERIGLHGRKFKMLKFRTMIIGAEDKRDELLDRNEMSGPVFKVTDDPRITPLGHFLRRTSLDELPQLVNVLFGSMSLVGPRPLPVREQQDIRGWQRRRLSMKPGITGLWQVSGRSEIDFEDWMKLDLRYVDEWSLGLDFKLLLKTIPAVVSKSGAK